MNDNCTAGKHAWSIAGKCLECGLQQPHYGEDLPIPMRLPCEQCGDLHGSTGTLSGFPILRCPSVTPPGVMYLKERQIVVGAEIGRVVAVPAELTPPAVADSTTRPRRSA